MIAERASDRQVFRITGADREEFLQGLVTNDVRRLAEGPVHAALLSPQGKYLADFLLLRDEGAGEPAVLLDVADVLAEGLLRRLSLYKLRADVRIAPAGLAVVRGLGTPPPGAVADPRHAALGWRLYLPEAAAGAAEYPATGSIDWDGIRVANCIPESGIELVADESYILEMGFERLHGVDHRKGCYVGQEVTARMKHRTELRKGLVTVEVEGDAAPGTEITSAGKPAGRLFTRAGDRAIAWLRFDRATGPLQAGAATVRWPDAATVA